MTSTQAKRKRRAQGLCGHCTKPSGDLYLCPPCARKARTAWRAKYGHSKWVEGGRGQRPKHTQLL